MMSLCVSADTAKFVIWTGPNSRMGRLVRLDSNGNIIPFVYYRFPPEAHRDGWEIKIVDTTARYAKIVRLPMPPWAILLKSWYQARIFPGPSCEPDDTRLCIRCAAVAHVTGEMLIDVLARPPALGDTARKCTSCALVWHERCAALCLCGDIFFDEHSVCLICRRMNTELGPIIDGL